MTRQSPPWPPPQTVNFPLMGLPNLPPCQIHREPCRTIHSPYPHLTLPSSLPISASLHPFGGFGIRPGSMVRVHLGPLPVLRNLKRLPYSCSPKESLLSTNRSAMGPSSVSIHRQRYSRPWRDCPDSIWKKGVEDLSSGGPSAIDPMHDSALTLGTHRDQQDTRCRYNRPNRSGLPSTVPDNICKNMRRRPYLGMIFLWGSIQTWLPSSIESS